jgi:hypothetical protein
MQARLEIRRFPAPLVAIAFAFAIALTLLLGASAGYVLKPATFVNSPARVVVVHDESALYATGGQNSVTSVGCTWINHQKEC